LNCLAFIAYVQSLRVVPAIFAYSRAIGVLGTTTFIRFFNSAQGAAVAGTMRAQQLVQQAAQIYPRLQGMDRHHLIPQYIVRAWQSAGVNIPTYITEARLLLPNAYHQLIHNEIVAALRGIDIYDPRNVQAILNRACPKSADGL
jgi:hypothetical protein